MVGCTMVSARFAARSLRKIAHRLTTVTSRRRLARLYICKNGTVSSKTYLTPPRGPQYSRNQNWRRGKVETALEIPRPAEHHAQRRVEGVVAIATVQAALETCCARSPRYAAALSVTKYDPPIPAWIRFMNGPVSLV